MRAVIIASVLSLTSCNAILGMEASTVAGSKAEGTLVAVAKNAPAQIQVKDSNIFWIESIDGGAGSTIMRVSRDGGAVTTLASMTTVAYRLAVDTTNVYWVDDDGTLHGVSVYGGAPFKLGSDYDGHIGSLALDQTSLYVTVGDPVSASIVKIPLAGGAAQPIVTGLDMLEEGNAPIELVVDTENVYWVTRSKVMKAPSSGGSPTTLASDIQTPTSLAIRGGALYWTSPADGTVKKLPVNGGVATTVAYGQDHPTTLAVDDVNGYWINDGENHTTIMKAPLAGGAVETVLDGESIPAGLAVDDTSLYWTNHWGPTPDYDHGAVMKRTPK